MALPKMTDLLAMAHAVADHEPWRQERPMFPHSGGPGLDKMLPVTGVDLLEDDGTGRPSPYLWNIWNKHATKLNGEFGECWVAWTRYSMGTGKTAIEAMIRALYDLLTAKPEEF